MKYIGLLWPRNEEQLIARGTAQIHGIARATRTSAAKDAQKLHKALCADDTHTGAYFVATQDGKVCGMYEVQARSDATQKGDARWIDHQYVRKNIGEDEADAYRKHGFIVTRNADGTCTADYPVQDVLQASQLIDTMREDNPTKGLSERVVAFLDKIRGEKSRYETAKTVRKELAKIPAPGAVQKEKEQRKKRAEETRNAVAKTLQRMKDGDADDRNELQVEIDRLQAKPKKTEQDKQSIKVFSSAIEQWQEAKELVGDCVDGQPPPSVTPTEMPWYDGQKAAVVVGKKTTIYIPSGKGAPEELPGQYVLVPVDRVGSSHDPWSFSETPKYDQNLQERDYHVAQQEQNKVVFGTQWFEPSFVINSTPSAVDGPPIIAKDGQVLGGNARSMMIRRSMKQNDRYTNALRVRLVDHAGVFGLSPKQATGVVLMRMITGTYDPKAISARLNTSFTQSIDDHAGAVSLGKRLPAETLELLAKEIGDQTLAAAIDSVSPILVGQLQRAEIITSYNESEWLVHKGGRVLPLLSIKGKERLRAGLLGAVIDDKSLLARMEAHGLRDIVERIAPVVLGVEQLENKWRDRYTMTEAIQLACEVLVDTLALSDVEFKAHFANYALFGGGKDAKIQDEVVQKPEVVSWMLWLREAAKGSRVTAARKARSAWASLPEFVRTSTQDIFGETDAPTRDAWFTRWALDAPSNIQVVGGRAWINGERVPVPKDTKKKKVGNVEQRVTNPAISALSEYSHGINVYPSSQRRNSMTQSQTMDLVSVYHGIECPRGDKQKIEKYLEKTPRAAEVLDWILKNLDPKIAPDGVWMEWNNFFNDEGLELKPMPSIQSKNPSLERAKERHRPQSELQKIWQRFNDELEAFEPNLDELILVVI